MQIISKIVSHYSLTKSIVRSDRLVEKAKELDIKTLILADINSMSGSVDFLKECKDIKPIIGVTLSLITEDLAAKGGTITLLAKNLNGWKSLLKIVSKANEPQYFKDHPQIPLSVIDELTYDDSLIVLTGGYNSHLANLMVNHEGRFAKTFEEVKGFANNGWVETCSEEIEYLKAVFGDNNVYLEIQKENLPINQLLNKGNRYLAKHCGVACIPSNPVHYLAEQDATDHHLMMCVGNKIKKSQLRELKDIENYPFICSSGFFLDASDEGYINKEEIDNLEKLGEKCETYKVFSNPRLPEFGCPNDKTDPEYLRELCRDGWKRKIEGKIPQKKIQEYADRVKEELDVVKYADGLVDEPLLSRYFLISQDYANFAKSKNIMMGPGRGSSGGSIIAYLTNITEIDPIEHDLIFSRFFNAGRISKDKFALPDIDMDFEIGGAEEVIQYITEKYGKERVGQVVTFGRLQGRGAMKEILRINEACGMDEMNQITSCIPDEAKIADDLQEMKDEGEEASIILWALQHNRDKLAKWCYLDENGKFQGEYARLFEQAVRLEGTLKTMGKHAAAIVISSDPLSEVCPVLHNKNSDDLLAGFEYEFLEGLGVLKCDILRVAALNKLSETQKLIKETMNV